MTCMSGGVSKEAHFSVNNLYFKLIILEILCISAEVPKERGGKLDHLHIQYGRHYGRIKINKAHFSACSQQFFTSI